MRIALTGGFGSGKSTVCDMFRKKGARIVDADRIVHELFAGDRRVLTAIRRRFGDAVFRDGHVDRRRLSDVIFTDPSARRALERIVHPAVRTRIRQRSRGPRSGLTVVDIPLLFESGWREKFDAVVVVTAGVERRISRLKGRGFSASEARRRMRAQLPMREKIRRADYVIDNDGSRTETKKQIDRLWKTLVFRKDA